MDKEKRDEIRSMVNELVGGLSDKQREQLIRLVDGEEQEDDEEQGFCLAVLVVALREATGR